MRRALIYSGTIIVVALVFCSCHLQDFNFNKLAEPNDIKPMVFAPLAYGTYKVDDYLTLVYTDNDTIKDPEIDLDPIIYDKTDVTFNSPAIDSVYLIAHFTNGTPMKMQFQIRFIDLNSGSTLGKTYDSGIIQAGKMDAAGNVTQSVVTRVEFPMDSKDLNNVSSANGIEFIIKLFQPDTGIVIVRNLKKSLFDVQLSFRAPLSLTKL